MKKISFFVDSVCAALLLAGCMSGPEAPQSGQPVTSKDQITGIWKFTDNEAVQYMEFNSDGTYRETDTIQHVPYGYTGTYTVNAGTIVLSITLPTSYEVLLENARIVDGCLVYRQRESDNAVIEIKLTRVNQQERQATGRL